MATSSAILELRHVNAIKAILEAKDDPRDYALFVIGIETALRASDLRLLTFAHFDGVPADGFIAIKESKVQRKGKSARVRHVAVNAAILDAVARLTAYRQPAIAQELLFPGKCLTDGLCTRHIARLVKSWCRAVGITYNIGAHTLRKTKAYHRRIHGASAELLQHFYGHQSTKATNFYLGVTSVEVDTVMRPPLI